jgi:hypothetical protein
MHRLIIRILGLALIALIVASAPTASSWARATTIHENVIIPVNYVTTHPCTGEEITVTGDLHSMFHFTFDDAAGALGMGHYNYQGLTAVGSVSGEVYRIAAEGGNATHTFNFYSPDVYNGATTFTSHSNVIIVGQGPDNNLARGRFLFHYTCNSSGCSVQFVNMSFSCQ